MDYSRKWIKTDGAALKGGARTGAVNRMAGRLPYRMAFSYFLSPDMPC